MGGIRNPGFPAGFGGITELHAAFLRKPHTRPWLGPRSRKSGVLRAFCEGWDITNLDTDRRVSHPLQRTQRMAHPPFRGASCRAKHQRRLNRELVSSQSSTGVADPPRHETGLFLFRKPHAWSLIVPRSTKSGGGVHRDSWYPTLRKQREGWGTRRFVALPPGTSSLLSIARNAC